MRALLILNPQNDYFPGGPLGVKDASKVVANINKAILHFNTVFATRNWFPEDSVHFSELPPHCVKETEGALFHEDLITRKFKRIIDKGTNQSDPELSAFKIKNNGLLAELEDLQINELYIAGFSTEYDVLQSALDAAQFGIKTFVFQDAIASINTNPGDREKAIETLTNNGVLLVSTKTLFL